MRTFPALTRRLVLLAATTAVVVLAGCGSASPSSSGTTGAAPSGQADTAGGMMGTGSSYHFSRLTCSAPSSLPGRTVTVTLADMGMTQMMGGTAPIGVHMTLRTSPDTVSAGQISLVASNVGWRTHELVILPLSSGAATGRRVPGPDGKVAETGSLGEASSSCGGGSGKGINAGTVSWTTVTLTPGTYELVCNLPNHYADGMYQQLVVT